MDRYNQNNSIELLAPAGSYESLTCAVRAGADAVYIGGAKFGARAYADNPDQDMLIEGIRYAHHYGVKIYMTVNTLLKTDEMRELYDYLRPYYEEGLDAVIVQDLGVYSYIREHFPDLSVHASTQMTVTGELTAKWLYDTGATRVVPARELSLQEIRDIHNSCDIEIECFVHGALCYSYSGQCLMSSILGGRSGNRGRCAQPCRLAYELYDSHGKKLNKSEDTTLLSCKDLCSLDILPDLIDAGVYSLKIEGRMKSPIYTAGVVSVWRKYVDMYLKFGRDGYHVESTDRSMLLELFDRGGQTDGYYHEHNGRDMMALLKKPEFRQTDDAIIDDIKRKYIDNESYIDIYAHATIKAEEPMKLVIDADITTDRCTGKTEHITVSSEGAVPDRAEKRAATEDDIRKQLLKMGGTIYRYSSLDIDADDGLFIPVKQLNELRRVAIDILDERILSIGRRSLPSEYHAMEGTGEAFTDSISYPSLNVVCSSYDQYTAAISSDGVSMISMETDMVTPNRYADIVECAHAAGKKIYLYMPHIYRTEAKTYFETNAGLIMEAGFDGCVVRNMEELLMISRKLRDDSLYADSDARPEIISDYTVYDMNHETEQVLRGLGVDRITMPVELNLHELWDLGCEGNELLIYGRLPMMVSAQCLKKNISRCDHKMELLMLRDRMGKEMPVCNHCLFCYNVIMNADPLSLIGISDDIMRLGMSVVRVWLTTEDKDESENIISSAIRAYGISGKFEKISDPVESYTRGHIRRGVQ